MGAGASSAEKGPPLAQQAKASEGTQGAAGAKGGDLASMYANTHVSEGTGATGFLMIPVESTLKTRANPVVLEVAPTGFRLLRPVTHEPLYEFLFPQIHSWVSHETRFGFRFYDKSKKLHYFTFLFSFPDNGNQSKTLLEVIHKCVQGILNDRLSKAMSDENFEQFLELFINTVPEEQIELLRETTNVNFFSSSQGHKVVAAVKDPFNRIDAAVLFHKCVTDQTKYSTVLEALDDPGDRENVWHRIDSAKKGGGSK